MTTSPDTLMVFTKKIVATKVIIYNIGKDTKVGC